MNRYVVFLTVLLALLFSSSVRNLAPTQTPAAFSTNSVTDRCENCASVLPGATVFSLRKSPPKIYEGFALNAPTGEKKLLGYVFYPSDIVKNINGFSGPIELLIGIDTHATIMGITCLSHSETTQYVNPIDRFLKQFLSKNPENAFRLGTDIDGITGATITSNAVTRITRESIHLVAEEVLNQKAATAASTTANPFIWLDIAFAAAILFATLLGIFLKARAWRWTALIVSLLYFGLAKAAFFSTVQTADIGLRHFQNLVENPLWYFFLLTAIILPFVFGRIYCSSICPFASVQEILYNSFQKFFLRTKISVPEKMDSRCRNSKFIILLLVLSLSFVVGNAAPAGVEVFITFFTGHGSLCAQLLLGAVLILSLVNFRFWCKYLCPSGALTSLFSLFSLFKIRSRGPCSLCQSCCQICPTNAITSSGDKLIVDPTECIVCAKCLTACPEGTLKFGLKKSGQAR